jgi:hypothetical protein
MYANSAREYDGSLSASCASEMYASARLGVPLADAPELRVLQRT